MHSALECPSEDRIVDLLDGRLPAAAAREVTEHLDECPDCRALVAEAARDGSSDGILRRGEPVGRYLILGPVGSGTMGTVYAAYDPELNRKVAIKVLRSDALAEGGQGLAPRLLREAQALARLSHQHVVSVYDLGRVGSRIFVAMEFVEGVTLTAWLQEKPRRWREVLQQFLQVGEGLAAAHEAGIVHRDVKPDNVLVGRDGRTRLADFGLARTPVPSDGPPGNAPAALALSASTTGQVGTPAYMAPEQLARAEADARSDQYGYCVALYEALAAPLAGLDRGALLAAVRSSRPRLAPRLPGPARIRQALLRGLSADPAARFPDMRALLRELERPRRDPLLAGAALALAALAAVALWLRPPPPCGGAEAAWGEIWSPAQRQRARAALASATVPAAFALLDGALGRFHEAWTKMHTEACRATRVRGEQSEALLDRRMECLADKRNGALALAHLVIEGGVEAASVGPAIATLPTLDACANSRALLERVPPPSDPALRSRAEGLAARLADALVLERTGHADRARASLLALVDETDRLGYAPLRARSLFQLSTVDYGPWEHREEWLTRAAAAGVEGRDDGATADAWTRLLYEYWVREHRPREAEAAARLAHAALSRLGGDPEREATLLLFEGDLASGTDDLVRGRALAARAAELYVKALGPDNWRLGSIEERLGNWDLLEGDAERALAHYRRSQVLRELNGPESVFVAASLMNQAEALLRLQRPAESLPLLVRALPLRRQRGVAATWYTLTLLGWAERALGRPADALERDRASLAALRSAEHGVDEAYPLVGIGLDLLALGRPGEGIADLRNALALRLTGVATDDELAEARLALAQALAAAGRSPREAVRLATQARDAWAALAQRHGGYFRSEAQRASAWLAARSAR